MTKKVLRKGQSVSDITKCEQVALLNKSDIIKCNSYFKVLQKSYKKVGYQSASVFTKLDTEVITKCVRYYKK